VFPKFPIGLILVGLFFSGCSIWSHLEQKNMLSSLIPNQMKPSTSFSHCKGKGHIASVKPIKGKLYFTFTSTHDSLIIHVKDFLGRRLYSVSGNQSELQMVNLRTDEIHDMDDLTSHPSFSTLFTSELLHNILWGDSSEISEIIGENPFMNDSDGTILFRSQHNSENDLIDFITIKLAEPKIDLTIQIVEREFFTNSTINPFIN